MAWQRKTPFGYHIVGGEIQLQEQETDAVRHIFHSYLAGCSYQQIADDMTMGHTPYHQHTAQWNKHMVKRILENENYLGAGRYPRIIDDASFTQAGLRRLEKTDYAPCPDVIDPIRKKAVCALCGGKMVRDRKSHGGPRWQCQNEDCRRRIPVEDDALHEQVVRRLHELGRMPQYITLPASPKMEPSSDGLRLERELNLALNRGESGELVRTFIFAAAAESYNTIPDPTPSHRLTCLRERLAGGNTEKDALLELLDTVVQGVCIGGNGITLQLINGKSIPEEAVS